MALSKALISSLLISLLFVLQIVQADEVVNTSAYYGGENIDCGPACEARCSESSRYKMCIRACGTCCARCNCVPPGTSGNEDVCPCYANMTTHGGRHKCP